MSVSIRPERVLRVLLIAVLFLAVAHLITATIINNIPFESHLRYVLAVFDMDQEVSVPTWFSQVALLLAGLVALGIGVSRRSSKQPYYRHWIAIACILIYMSLDEGSSLHELTGAPIEAALNTSGTFLQFGWVIVGVAAVVVVGLVFLRFWWRLPARTRNLVMISGLIYVIGAVIIEMIGGYYFSHRGPDMIYRTIVMFEESFELIGACLAVYSFLDFWRSDKKRSFIDIV